MKAHLSSCFSSSQTVMSPTTWASGEPLATDSCITDSSRLSRVAKASGSARPGRDTSAACGEATPRDAHYLEYISLHSLTSFQLQRVGHRSSSRYVGGYRETGKRASFAGGYLDSTSQCTPSSSNSPRSPRTHARTRNGTVALRGIIIIHLQIHD